MFHGTYIRKVYMSLVNNGSIYYVVLLYQVFHFVIYI